MVDLVPEGWEHAAHLAIGEIRDDGSIDLFFLLETGTLRYIATLDPQDSTGIVPAPEPFRHLARFTHEVLATNTPLIRRPSTVDKGFLLSSVLWDMVPVYSAMVEDLKAGTFGTKHYSIQLSDDSVRLLHTSHIPDEVWKQVMAVRDEIVGGKMMLKPVFDAQEVRALMTSVQDAPK